jgi:tetratricopeptide (TPR) repeat protein
LILERAEGNPLFCEELAYALRDTGLITIGDGECRLAPHADDLHALRLPDTVQGVVTSRIDRLPPQQQLILKVASVIGREFTFRLLEKIYPMESDRSKLPEYLAALQRLDLIRRVTPESEMAYIFKHAITQEVAYNLMLFAQRRELHRQAGLTVEILFPDKLSEVHGLLATHYFKGEVWDKAVDYLTKAGDAAVRLNAHAEARKYYAEALESLSHLPYTYTNRRLYIDLILKQVSISWGAKAPEQNLRHLAEAESLAKALPDPDDGMLGAGDPVRLARVHLWMGRSHYYRNAPDEAINCFWQVLADAHSIGNETLPAILSSAMAQALLVQGQFGQARSILTQSAPLLEQAGNWPEWIQAVGGLGVSLAASGRCEEALAEGRRALAAAKEMNDIASVAVSNINLCIIHLLSGDVSSCFEAGCVAVKAAEQSGNQLYVYLSYGFLGWAEGRLGQYAAAQERFRLARAASQPLGHELVFSDWFAAAQAEIALKAGHAEEALQLAKQAVATAQAAERFYSRGLAHRVWGQALAVLTPFKQTDTVAEHLAESKRCFDAGEAWLESAHTLELSECDRPPLLQLTMASLS